MRKTRARLIAPLAVIAVCSLFAGVAGGEGGDRGYSTEISIQPKGDVFLLKAKVTDLASGQVLAAPSGKLAAGVTSDMETTLPDETMVRFHTTVESSGHAASYSITVERGTRVLSSHSAKIVL